ncbi:MULTISPECIES: hypothetical protein [Raoultella]|uniref:hypothetical protein n=1 Tax=Raoultella TaxID=160674 RepID=UPI001C7DECF6|nr:hypothetical protein [Raoultella ornithinolytica]EKW3528319.1 hypothetical protein [Raoultella planticola]
MTDITELAQREKFEAWFKSSFHPDKTGPYIKDQLFFAWKAAGAELVEALEKAQRHANLTEEERQAYLGLISKRDERIAELESRTVTIEPFRSFVTDADLAALHRFAECCDDPESGGHDLEKEQVRRLEEIGALRRSGRVHWITGFGDVLISITAGIKWEAE